MLRLAELYRKISFRCYDFWLASAAYFGEPTARFRLEQYPKTLLLNLGAWFFHDCGKRDISPWKDSYPKTSYAGSQDGFKLPFYNYQIQYGTAFLLFEMAARKEKELGQQCTHKGSDVALSYLIYMYYEGLGVEKNVSFAKQLCKRALGTAILGSFNVIRQRELETDPQNRADFQKVPILVELQGDYTFSEDIYLFFSLEIKGSLKLDSKIYLRPSCCLLLPCATVTVSNRGKVQVAVKPNFFARKYKQSLSHKVSYQSAIPHTYAHPEALSYVIQRDGFNYSYFPSTLETRDLKWVELEDGGRLDLNVMSIWKKYL
jgi:hypothetical protein